jgi:broad specificity phosphatase PhoE
MQDMLQNLPRLDVAVDTLKIRHAPSTENLVWDAWGRGDKDVLTPQFLAIHTSKHGLTKQGKEATLAVAPYIQKYVYAVTKKSRGVLRAHASPWLRAQQTRALLQFPHTLLWRDEPLLIERSYGSALGVNPNEWPMRYPEFNDAYHTNRWHALPPEGESHACVVEKRLTPFAAQQYALHPHDMHISITHAEVMKSWYGHTHRLSPTKFHTWVSGKSVRDLVPNLVLHHYTRRSPDSGKVHTNHLWFRAITPEDFATGRLPEWRYVA